MESPSRHRDRDLIPGPSAPKARPRSQTPLQRIPPKPETKEQKVERLKQHYADCVARRDAHMLELAARQSVPTSKVPARSGSAPVRTPPALARSSSSRRESPISPRPKAWAFSKRDGDNWTCGFCDQKSNVNARCRKCD
eukprot:12420127-Karenia_brevis.AAC.1